MNFGNLELGCALESVMWLQAVLWILHNAFFLPKKKKKKKTIDSLGKKKIIIL